MASEATEEEIELCQAIFDETECEVVASDGATTTVTLHVRPSTTGEDCDSLFVLATLVLQLPHGYPSAELPSMTVSKSQGLDDAQIRHLLASLHELADEQAGEPMILCLAEATKDFLDEHNAPPDECAVCLDALGKDGSLVRPGCLHCFHDTCFAKWWLTLQSEAEARRAANPYAAHAVLTPQCPVCRARVGEAAMEIVASAVEVHTRQSRVKAALAAASARLIELQDGDGSRGRAAAPGAGTRGGARAGRARHHREELANQRGQASAGGEAG
jgi:hypothetical protein